MSAAFRRRPKGYGGHSEVDEGHTILSRAGGPALLLLERACGEPAEDRKRSSVPACEAGCSTPRSPDQGTYGGSRDDPAPSLRQALTRCRCRMGSGEAGQGTVNEHAV